MKVLDMFGCGLPVCAIGFKCLDELVQHDKYVYKVYVHTLPHRVCHVDSLRCSLLHRNGLVFESPEQLCTQVYGLLKGYPIDTPQLNRLRSSLQTVEVGIFCYQLLFSMLPTILTL